MNKLILAGVAVAALAVPALAQLAMVDRQGEKPAAASQTRTEAEAKVRTQFGALDANKDGFVTRDEIRAHTDAMIAKHRTAAFDALDTDRNGSLSRAEFEAQRERRVERIIMRSGGDSAAPKAPGADGAYRQHRMFMDHHGGMAGAMMLMGAMDADGRISIDAAVKQALARFDKADANKDGTLTPEERRAARNAQRSEWRSALS